MKSTERKKRIREALRAEGLAGNGGDVNTKSWMAFKKQLNAEFLAAKTPPLEIISARRQPALFSRWLVPAFAVLAVVVSAVLWRGTQVTEHKPIIAETITKPAPIARSMRQGDVFKSEKREIRFLGGSATLLEAGDKIRIEATALKADFRLKQKVDMQIEHPLVRITITGTEFVLNTSAQRGIIHLSEGRLRIDLKSSPGAKPVILVAPVRFDFSEKSHQIKKAETSKDQVLYRYELVNGEVFFAHQISKDTKLHKVEVLGGKVQEIAVEEILRFVSVEKP